MHIRTGDTVEVIVGDDRDISPRRGEKGKAVRRKVLKVLRDEGKVIVEGVNRVFKHMRRSQRNPQGGRLSKEMPIQISNVMLVCASCDSRTRTGARVLQDGSKERYCKRCGASMGQISPPRERRKPAAVGGK